jgi:RNA polymerase sigma-70 factor, ECF subfamily
LQEKTAAQAWVTLSELFEEYEAGLRRYARYLCEDADWADDLVADTLLKTMPHLGMLSQMHPSQCKAWLYRVLKNQFLDALRQRKREKRLFEQLAETEMEIEPEEAFSLADTSMPPNHRNILQMRYWMGLSSEEIGRKLGIPAATARSRLRLAIQWLKNHHVQGE